MTAIVCIGESLWIRSELSTSDNSAANLQREFSREQDRASLAVGGLTAGRESQNAALAEALESKRIANSKQMELKQALDKSEERALALERENAAQKQADAKQMELKQALDKSEERALALERENAAQKQANDKQAELKQALDESEKRALALEHENVAQKQIADARQTELKQALDKSGARSEALARELASARKNDVAAGDLAAARERENAAQKKQMELKQALDESEKRALALEHENVAQKQIADARQTELKQALDKSGARSEALARELASARKAIASAEKPSNVDVTARDAASPTGSRPMEGSNGASEITGSMPTPQSGGNGVQTSSEAAADDATAGASGQLTRSNRSQPARSQPPHAMTSAEEAKLVARANL